MIRKERPWGEGETCYPNGACIIFHWVPSTLHITLKFIWEDHEIVIHGEGSNCSYPVFFVPIIEDSSQFIDFPMGKIMKIAFEDKTPQVRTPPMYKMLATTILRSSFEPRHGLGKNFDGISKPLSIPLQNYHFGVSYTPIEEELFKAEERKMHDHDIPKPIP